MTVKLSPSGRLVSVIAEGIALPDGTELFATDDLDDGETIVRSGASLVGRALPTMGALYSSVPAPTSFAAPNDPVRAAGTLVALASSDTWTVAGGELVYTGQPGLALLHLTSVLTGTPGDSVCLLLAQNGTIIGSGGGACTATVGATGEATPVVSLSRTLATGDAFAVWLKNNAATNAVTWFGTLTALAVPS